MRIEPHIDSGRSEPILNDNSLVLYLNDNGKTDTKWMDRSGKNNHGTVYGAGTPPPATPGALGYTFDGVDDYVDAGNAASLDITSAITLSTWVYPLSLTEDGYIISKTSNGVVNSGYGLYWQGSTNAIATFVTNPTVSSSAVFTESNSWVHIVFVYNGSNTSFYKNGQLVNVGVNISIPSTVANVVIGNRAGGASAATFFNGTIDEVRIYNRALSQGEIKQLFNQTKGKFGV